MFQQVFHQLVQLFHQFQMSKVRSLTCSCWRYFLCFYCLVLVSLPAKRSGKSVFFCLLSLFAVFGVVSEKKAPVKDPLEIDTSDPDFIPTDTEQVSTPPPKKRIPRKPKRQVEKRQPLANSLLFFFVVCSMITFRCCCTSCSEKKRKVPNNPFVPQSFNGSCGPSERPPRRKFSADDFLASVLQDPNFPPHANPMFTFGDPNGPTQTSIDLAGVFFFCCLCFVSLTCYIRI